MSNPSKIPKNAKISHYSVGALIQKGDKFLLILHKVYGYAGVAGHVDKNESPRAAVRREVREESGLSVMRVKLLFEEEILRNWCTKGITGHYWYLFKCEVTGRLRRDPRETKSVGWYTIAEIKKLKLEPVWQYWFKKLKLLPV